jgi:hypothetical protein
VRVGEETPNQMREFRKRRSAPMALDFRSSLLVTPVLPIRSCEIGAGRGAGLSHDWSVSRSRFPHPEAFA